MTPPIPWPGFDIDHDSCVARAVRRIGEILADGQWHRWTDIVAPVCAEFGLKPKTVDLLLYKMAQTGGVERNRCRRADRRMVKAAIR